MTVSAARRAGKGHRKVGLPCQDAVAWQRLDNGVIILAVADGLGSRRLSEIGSRVAAQAAVDRLVQSKTWDVRAMLRAFRAARRAIRLEAKERGVHMGDLATTLQVGVLTPERAVCAMVGDGGWIAGVGGVPVILSAPADGGYANEVTPVTSSFWRLSFTCTSRSGATWLAGFSDGLTRLLMTKQQTGWVAHKPFFEAFVPRLQTSRDEGLAERFLAGDHVDAAWDDDKSLVVAVVHETV